MKGPAQGPFPFLPVIPLSYGWAAAAIRFSFCNKTPVLSPYPGGRANGDSTAMALAQIEKKYDGGPAWDAK